jgi:single-strand DNA-binding protein
MPSFNQAILMGHATRDPQVKSLPSGSTVCEFGIAVNHKWRNANGEDREEVCFMDCAAFGKVGGVIAGHITKGRALMVIGRLKQDTWEDKQSGAKRSKISLIVENFRFVGDRGPEQEQPTQKPNGGFQNPRDRARANAPREAPFRDADPGIPSEDIPF